MAGQVLVVPPNVAEVLAPIERHLHPGALLIVISGPSGAGKDSVVRRMRELDHPFHFVVTTTDRSPRPGEENGVDYHFVTTAEFKRMIANDELFEYALVYGQYKGVPKAQVHQALSSGIDVIMRLDVQGAATMRRLVPQSLSIFLVPPSLDVLIDRLCRREGDSPEQLQKRLETALAEMNCFEEFEYLVINREGRLDEAVEQIAAIIKAEKCRVVRRQPLV